MKPRLSTAKVDRIKHAKIAYYSNMLNLKIIDAYDEAIEDYIKVLEDRFKAKYQDANDYINCINDFAIKAKEIELWPSN